jgi:hypothetical protein
MRNLLEMVPRLRLPTLGPDHCSISLSCQVLY